jgi:uncharacterized membrane protein
MTRKLRYQRGTLMNSRRTAISHSLLITAFIAAMMVFDLPERVEAAVAQFIPLGFLPNGNDSSFATSVSNGGVLTVVGYAGTPSQAREAFIWTQAGGMVGLGVDWATAISANGNVVVGGDPLGTGWRWTAATGAVSIGSGQPTGVSSDGSVISGDNNDTGYRWTAATGEVPLPIPPGASTSYSPALGISANGQYIVGQAATPVSGSYRAYRYDTINGYQLQQAGNGANTIDSAYAITPDGRTIVGDADIGGNGEMGVRINGVLAYTATNGNANAVSNDGNFVVGSYFQRAGSAFIWDPKDGARSLQTVLTTQYGLNLTGWSLEDATDITGDGNTITGYGIDPQGFNEAFVAILPEPNAFCILAIVGCLLLCRRPIYRIAPPIDIEL